MNWKIILLTFALGFAGCSSIDLPTVEQSQKSINISKLQIDSLSSNIKMKRLALPAGNDVIVRINMNALNKIIEPIANNREDDIKIDFPPTKPVMSEDKSILGIKYTNYINVESGSLIANLKKFRFERMHLNKIGTTLEVEGKGNLSVSGRYMGVPASVSPEIYMYLFESVSLSLTSTKNGEIVLNPEQKGMILKTKFTVSLLGWQVPWYQEVPLEFTDMIKPLSFPIALKSEIQFPLPAKTFGDQKLEFAPYLLELSNSKVSAANNKLEYRTDVDFRRK
jgi:hypothetical protein